MTARNQPFDRADDCGDEDQALDSPADPGRANSRFRTDRSDRRLRAAVAVTGLVALVAGAFGFVLATNRGAAHATAARPSPQSQAAREARAARTYTWTAVPGAASYEFEIRRGEDVVFETTTTDVSVQLPARLRLSPGRYTWLVTPTYEKPAARLHPASGRGGNVPGASNRQVTRLERR